MPLPPEDGQRCSVDGYLDAIDSVPGWFSRLDAAIFRTVDRLQRQRGIRGDLLEIGVYQGRSAILMGYLCSPGERLLVCDPFDSRTALTVENAAESDHYYRDLRREQFESHYRRFHPNLPDMVVAPSDTLDRAALAGRFRFVHIDGSHTYHAVREDIATARALVGPGGVVAFDDWTQPHAAGVALAVWEELLRGELIPLGVTNDKFYGTWDPAGLNAGDLEEWAAVDPAVALTEPMVLRSHSLRRFVPVGPPPPIEHESPISDAPPAEADRPRWRRFVRQVAPPVALDAYRRLRDEWRGRGGRRAEG